MSRPLFRPEALAARSGLRLASTPLPLPPGMQVMIALAAALAAALVALLLFGQYAPRDTVRGYVSTSAGDIRVLAPGAGAVHRLLVSEGDRVRKGARLVLLETARAAARSAETQDAVLESLQSEQEALETERLNLAHSLDIQEQRYRDENRRLEQRLALFGEQQRILSAAEQVAGSELERLSRIDGGFVSARELDVGKSRVHEIELRQQQLEIEIRDARNLVERNRSLLEEHPLQRSLKLATIESSLQRLGTRLAEARGFYQQVVSAPASGIVTGLLVKEGQTVSSSSTLLSIVPIDATFEAELLIPTRTIAFVRAGATIRLRYDALPYQKFGTFNGTIRSVSRTTTLPAEKAFPLPVTEAVYLARAELDTMPPWQHEAPELQAGMTFTADVMRDRRRLAEWLFAPVIRAGSRL